MRTPWFFPIAAGMLLTGCATLPTGPNVLVLPGSGKGFDEFQLDDAVCRQWASQQLGTTNKQAATEATVTGAVNGTALGAAGGAAVGAAAGSPATGAAVGSGVGLVGGTAAGAERGAGAEWRLQRRYDMAYMQCMYAKGNLIPVSGSFQRPPASTQQGSSAPPPLDVPPPPPGNPPPPPTDY
jgi:Glycine-zipper domain